MAWSKKVKYIEFPVVAKPEATIQTWKKTGAVQELLKVSSLEITAPEEPVQLVEEVEPDQPLRSLTKFRIHREDVEFEKKHPRVSAGTEKGGEFTKKHLKDDVWAEGNFIYHMDTGYPLKIINKDGSLYAQDKAGVVYTIGSVWKHYSKVPPDNSIYKGMTLTDWPDEKKEPPKEEPAAKEEPNNKFEIGDTVQWKGINPEFLYKVVGLKPPDFEIQLISPKTNVNIGKVYHNEHMKYYELYKEKIDTSSLQLVKEKGLAAFLAPDSDIKPGFNLAKQFADYYDTSNVFKVNDVVRLDKTHVPKEFLDYYKDKGPGYDLDTQIGPFTILSSNEKAGQGQVVFLMMDSGKHWAVPSYWLKYDFTENPKFKVGDIIQSGTSKYKYKITKIENGMAYGFLLDNSGKPTPGESETGLAKIDYLQSGDYKVVSHATLAPNVAANLKKFKIDHTVATRPDIPQVFNVGDKVSFRGKMYFVKYVNPKDHMVQIELAKIRHGVVKGVVTGCHREREARYDPAVGGKA